MKTFFKTIFILFILCCGLAITANATNVSIDSFISNNDELLQRQHCAHQMAEYARALGYSEEHFIIKTAQDEWWDAQAQIIANREESEDWLNKFAEYPSATYVWLYLVEELGYNNYVAAGIMGNLMAEVGGGTLDLQYKLYSSSDEYYGMCQWSKKYYPQIRGCGLEEQCDFLAQTIEYEINNFGYKYAKGYKYADFIALQDVEDAALMFAKTYERCADWTYERRLRFANKAYDYFID